MNYIPQQVRVYFNKTNTLLYSYLASLPLLAGYEILLLISQPTTDHMVRISVDVWIRYFIQLIGVNSTGIFLMLIALIGLIVLYRDRENFANLKTSYFPILLIESMVYALAVGFFISSLTTDITMVMPQDIIDNDIGTLQWLSLSLGAGLYEELFFRVFLYFLFMWVFSKFLDKKWASISLSVIASSLLFSLAHFTGSYGEAFTMYAFLFRFLFGVALTVIYARRGFAVAAWTHALYDIFVVTFR